MRPGFMSSVFPKQTLGELIGTAQEYGYEGLEFRVEWDHRHGVELAASEAQLQDARRLLADGGIAASCIATSVKFNSLDVADHLPQRESLRQYIVLAAQVGAPVIRTFSDGLPEDAADRDTVLHLAAESYAAVDAWAREHGIVVLVETHTNMKGQWAKQILDEARATNLEVLWHTGHHLQRGQSVNEAYGYIKGHVRHVHFTAESDSKHVTDADNQRMFDLLALDGFEGFLSVELINPEDPDAVLAHHIKKYHQYLGR
jgi:sugar phosphate isomerase/epimerase